MRRSFGPTVLLLSWASSTLAFPTVVLRRQVQNETGPLNGKGVAWNGTAGDWTRFDETFNTTEFATLPVNETANEVQNAEVDEEGLGSIGLQAFEDGTCPDPIVRRSWHSLSDNERREYIQAEKCLMNLPGRTNMPGANSRHADLTKAHQLQAAIIHHTGLFLPFHRLFTWAHEQLLRNECGYTGGQPYWDEPLDAGRFSASILLNNSDTGFGGNGENGSGCVREGPFANHTLFAGPGWVNTEHCLARAVNDTASLLSSQENVDACMRLETFQSAWLCIEDMPHRGGHAGIAGEMNDAITSPSEPLFYLHHGWIDKLWWDWQMKDLPNRTNVTGGYTTMVQPQGGWQLVTLDYDMDMFGIVPNARVGEVADTRGSRFCYVYE